MKIIDPHVHLFDLSTGDYQWLKPDNPPYWSDKNTINRSFGEGDLTLLDAKKLSGFVHIEAGYDNHAPWREIMWLEASVSLPFKSIASVDLSLSPDKFTELIVELTSLVSVVGVRHIFDDEACHLLQQPQVIENLGTLAKHQLIFETQIASDTPSVNAFVTMAKTLPQLTCILSHALFCPYNINQRAIWQMHIKQLAQCANVSIKASGWEMVTRDYNPSHILDVVLMLTKEFGDRRVMLASNFPLTLFSQSLGQLWQQYSALNIAKEVLANLMFNNANRYYRVVDDLIES